MTAAGATGIVTAVTTSRTGARSTGFSSATTSRASSFDRWKKRGSISSRFSGVSTFASSGTLVMQIRPSSSGATISGTRCTSSAAVFR